MATCPSNPVTEVSQAPQHPDRRPITVVRTKEADDTNGVARGIIETQSCKLGALSSLLGLLGEHMGIEGNSYYSIMYSIEDVKQNIDRAVRMMAEAVRS